MIPLTTLLLLLPIVFAYDTHVHRNNDASAPAEVIILGGGISGISVARTLIQDYNITNILLIEGRDELGGRAHTEQLVGADGQTVTVEKGCNWIQGPGREVIKALADKWGLKTTPTDYDSTIYFEGKVGVLGDAQKSSAGTFLSDNETAVFTEGYDNFLDNAGGYATYRQNNSLVDISVRVATSIMDWIPITPMQKLYEYWNVDFTFAQTPEESSFANAFGQEVGLEGSDDPDLFVIDQRGYKYLFVQEAKELFGQDLSDPRLHLRTTVKRIDYTDSNLTRVETDQGDFFAAKFVVSTMSLGVLQNQDVTWNPRLPDWKKEAIFTFNMATYMKIFMLFPTQFWPEEQFTLYGDPDVRGAMAVWQNINAPGYFPQNTSSNVIMVTAVDQLARTFELLPDVEIQASAMKVLREMFGDDIPDPDDIVVPRWNSDPLYRGSYSNWPLGVLDQHHENLRQPVGDGRIMFTGEAMSPDAFGYVQGAWTQGQETAQRIGQCLSGGDCPQAEVYETLKMCNQAATDETLLRSRGVSRMAKRHGRPGGRRVRRRGGS